MTTIADLSRSLNVPLPVVVKALLGAGHMKAATQPLSDEEVELVREYLRRPPDEGGASGVREPRGPRPPEPASGATPTTPED